MCFPRTKGFSWLQSASVSSLNTISQRQFIAKSVGDYTLVDGASSIARPESGPIKYAKDFARYTTHGIIVSLTLIVIYISLTLIFPPSLFSDLALSVTILFLSCFILVLIGIINAYTTDYLWKKETSMHWLSLLCHGFLLSIGSLLILLGSVLFFVIAETTYPIISRVSAVPVIVLIVFVNGAYGKSVANYVTYIGSLLHAQKQATNR